MPRPYRATASAAADAVAAAHPVGPEFDWKRMHSTTLGRVWNTPESDQRWYPERGSCHPRITIDTEQFLRADAAAITGLGAGAIMGEGAGTGFGASTGFTLATIGRNSRSTRSFAHLSSLASTLASRR